MLLFAFGFAISVNLNLFFLKIDFSVLTLPVPDLLHQCLPWIIGVDDEPQLGHENKWRDLQVPVQAVEVQDRAESTIVPSDVEVG